MRTPRGRAWLALGLLGVAAAGCRADSPIESYPITGQILAVDAAQQQITIRHEDIPGLMPGMTMSFPVSSPELMTGREPGELVTGTLEVSDATGRLTALTRTGMAPLPDDANLTTLATGLLEVGDQVPDTAFIDQRDQRRSFSEWKGHYTLVTFIYTRCPLPNFCPLMDQNFATLQRAIGEDDLLRGRVKLVSISFDPDHDTPAVLAAWAAKRRADPDVWTFLTGDRITVDRFAARFGVGVIRVGDTTEITHNLRTALIDPELEVAAIYSGNEWTPGEVLADLRAALRHP